MSNDASDQQYSCLNFASCTEYLTILIMFERTFVRLRGFEAGDVN